MNDFLSTKSGAHLLLLKRKKGGYSKKSHLYKHHCLAILFMKTGFVIAIVDFSNKCGAFNNGVLKGFTAMFQCSGMLSWTVFLAIFYLIWVTSLFVSQCHQVCLYSLEFFLINLVSQTEAIPMCYILDIFTVLHYLSQYQLCYLTS